MGPSSAWGGREAGKDGAAMLFLRTGRQVFLSCGRASAEPFCGEPGQRAHNRPGVARGLRGLVLFDSARLAPRRGGPSSPSSCPPLPEQLPPTWLRVCGHRLPVLLDGGRHQPGVRVVKQAWAGGCTCLVLGCTDMKLYSKQDLSHPRALPFSSHHTAFLCVVRGPKLGQALHPFLPS